MRRILKTIKGTLAAPPEPFLITRRSRDRVSAVIDSVGANAVILNVGAGYSRLSERTINVEIFDSGTTDVVASALALPFADGAADLVILQGVLEHVEDAHQVIAECTRVLKTGALFFTEMPFLQPYHECPIDVCRSTRFGLSRLCRPLTEVESGIHIGPASALTWFLREFLARLDLVWTARNLSTRLQPGRLGGLPDQVPGLRFRETAPPLHGRQLVLLPGPEMTGTTTAPLPKGPTRVAHLIETLDSGGAERLLYTNLKHLDPARIQSTVYTVFPSSDHWAGPIRALGVDVIDLGCRNYRQLPLGVVRLRRLLKARRPHLLHTHLWAANVIGRIAGRLGGVPVVSSIHCTEHEPEAWADGADVSLAKRRLIQAIDCWSAYFGCRRVIAVSEYVRRSTARRLRFPIDRIDLLYNPIDLEDFDPGPAHASVSVVDGLRLPTNRRVLLHVGRVSPQKGLMHAIRALPAIRTRFPETHLISVGATTDARWTDRLKAEVEAQGQQRHVHFLGVRRDIPELLRACDVFVFPSLYEGLGIALIEAMAAGCACVASTAGPIPEVITDGVDGVLVPPGDPAALADAVASLLADPSLREAIGRAAAASSASRFEPQAAASTLAGLYESMLNGHSGTGSA